MLKKRFYISYGSIDLFTGFTSLDPCLPEWSRFFPKYYDSVDDLLKDWVILRCAGYRSDLHIVQEIYQVG